MKNDINKMSMSELCESLEEIRQEVFKRIQDMDIGENFSSKASVEYLRKFFIKELGMKVDEDGYLTLGSIKEQLLERHKNGN